MTAKASALLKRRRKEFNIPDGAFRQAALFDRVLIWQITDHEGEKFAADGRVLMPEVSKKRRLDQAPRGIVVTAGLHALDCLRTNGVQEGSIVKFVRLSPWRMPIGIVEGKEVEVHVCRVGDIVACEDLAEQLRAGKAAIAPDANGRHVLTVDGVTYTPDSPTATDDY